MSFITDLFAKKAPPAPTGSDLTAAQKQANQVNQYTPNFNQVYGSVDANGNFVARPGAEAVQVTESPEAKALRERIQGVTQNFANSLQTPANMDLSRLPSLTNESQIRANVGSGEDIRNAQFKQATDLLNPQFDREQERLDQRLADQGIYRGSSNEDAYSRAQGDFSRNKNASLENAALSAILAGGAEQNRQYGNELSLAGYTSGQRAQGFGEQGSMRNQSFNELASINGLAPLPSFVNTPSIDAAGNMLASNAIQSNNVNARNAMTAQILGAGAGVAGMAAASDMRLKEKIKYAGKKNGFNLYEFKYKNKEGRYRGVMAQEIQKIRADAVTMIDGFLHVFYDKIGLKMEAA